MPARPSGKSRYYKEKRASGIFKIGPYSRISFDMDVWNRVIPHSCSTSVYLFALFISETRQAMYL